MKKYYISIGIICLMLSGIPVWAAQPNTGSIDKILKGIEKRYEGKGFSATFFQESTLKAMQITDTAEGNLTVKRPGKMRWQYISPDEQTIITDGNSLWVYRPADNQVMIGKAPDFFGQGNGAGFLSDIASIRSNFEITLHTAKNDQYHRLQLLPKNPTPDLTKIILSIDKSTYQADQVLTYNTYGDQTRIILKKYRYNLDFNDALFNFTIPEGVDIVHIDKP
ncbi:MAG: outer membrane lipoprotein chaperone LolA [Desulfobacteraceae bacterium]|nr:outer membrane lipoprotein chaperone LolA [Desulfobacteraceae bacterium]